MRGQNILFKGYLSYPIINHTMNVITDSQIDILESLGRYKYLTNTQFLKTVPRINTLLHMQKVTKQLAKNEGLMGSIDFPLVTGKGRLEKIYYLTRKGRRFLAEILRIPESTIDYNPYHTRYESDYFHRKALIDFHISLAQSLKETQFEIGFFHRYFDHVRNKQGENRDGQGLPLTWKTQVYLDKATFMIPDALFSIQIKEEPSDSCLYVLEVCNGEENDARRVMRQIKKHAEALSLNAIQRC